MKNQNNECGFFNLPESVLREFKKNLLWYLSREQVKKICEAKETDLVTVFLDEMSVSKHPDEDYNCDLTVGVARDFERRLATLFSASQVELANKSENFRKAVIAEVRKKMRICPPDWFNPSQMMMRVVKFLEKHGAEFAHSTAISDNAKSIDFIQSLIPCPMPTPYYHKDGIFTFLGVFLPDKDDEDGWFRTLKAWWEFLELPAELAKEGKKFIEFGGREKSTREFGVGKVGEKMGYDSGVGWITLDLRSYMGLDNNYSSILCDGKKASLGVLMLAGLCPEWASYWIDGSNADRAWVDFADPWHTDSSDTNTPLIYLRLMRPKDAKYHNVECGMYLLDGPHTHIDNKN